MPQIASRPPGASGNEVLSNGLALNIACSSGLVEGNGALMPIDGEWIPKLVTERRCDSKRSMWRKQAERRAAAASNKSGSLIIAYKCFDCVGWHIAHASYEELIARERDVELVRSRKPIPAIKFEAYIVPETPAEPLPVSRLILPQIGPRPVYQGAPIPEEKYVSKALGEKTIGDCKSCGKSYRWYAVGENVCPLCDLPLFKQTYVVGGRRKKRKK